MRKENGELWLSASDLANHLGCRHLTQLDLAVARGTLQPPTWRDPAAVILQERGLNLEQAYLAHLRGQELSISEPEPNEKSSGIQRTLSAMQEGVEIIYQAVLQKGRWHGRADFLRRVDRPGTLGNWSYEVQDAKLARETRGGTILQLCLYSHMVADIQGVLPEQMHVITPEQDFKPLTFRLHDFLAYYRLVQRRLEEAAGPATHPQLTYPDPVSQCEVCRWWQDCDRRRHHDDHLCLVAGISKLHIKEIHNWGVTTMEKLAQVPLPLEHRPTRGALETYERIREQARVQVEGRNSGQPTFELLPLVEGQGFYRLPEPSPGDIFLDFEGDPFVGTAGLEYLLGWTVGSLTDLEYHRHWALGAAQEKKAFEEFMDMTMERWRRFPDLHIYHFAPYEPATLKRLMGRYATREEELDRMLRAELLVDLHAVAKQAIRASVERYSLKDLEIFYDFERQIQLREATHHLHDLQRALELSQSDTITEETRRAVASYNRDDCVSTMHLRGWLEQLRVDLTSEGRTIPRPELQSGDPSETLDEQQQAVRELYQGLAGEISPDPSSQNEEQRGRWLLANMLDWHRREKKSVFWEYHRLRGLSDEDLLEERASLSGLGFIQRINTIGKSVVDRYRFPPQESDVREGDALKTGQGANMGTVYRVDHPGCFLDIKKGPTIADLHPTSIFKHTLYGDDVKRDAIMRLGAWVAENGIDSEGPYRAGRDLLMKRLPRPNRECLQSEDPVTIAQDWGLALDHSTLPIQGPPGAGKTYTAAYMIHALVGRGKNVGITALSHKVIRNLLDKVLEIAGGNHANVRCIQKVNEVSGATIPSLTETKRNDAILTALQSGSANVAGGTAWLWARPEFFEEVDVLFVDEAGQLALADVLAVSQAAKSVVLLGDPQQLRQPLQGSHPEGTDVSALEHLLGEHQTLQPDRGLFLDRTWRMHPSICAFTSELFYEGRLHSRANLDRQILEGPTPFEGAGLWFIPIMHEGNQNSSVEEVECIVRLIDDLTKENIHWTDDKGEKRPLNLSHILIITPYNAQVACLNAHLPTGTRIGTVDKFQGQEAPVVICSLCTSSPEDAPRSMEFLYSLNRFNVAVSRARTACILVANPRLFEPDCRTPSQMRLANAFCRYLEMAQTLSFTNN